MKKLTFLVLITYFLSSCAGVGFIAGGKVTTFQGNYELPIQNNLEESKSKLKEILFTDNWNKSSETENVVTFQNVTSAGTTGLIGINQNATITATFVSESIKLKIYQVGNFKFGTEKSANKTFNEIKSQYGL
jgi:hypothetical protein